MMEQEKLKETVLLNLRSVIQSCKGGVPINRLQSDYKQLVGTTIPYDALGYKLLVGFLQSIPHVVKLHRSPDGQVLVQAVSDTTTSHLENLINRQKSTKTTPKCSYKTYKKPSSRSKASSTRPSNGLPKRTSNAADQSQVRVGGLSSASSTYSTASEASWVRDKEMESLRSRLEEQTRVNGILSARVDRLLAGSEPILEDEQVMIQRLKYQVGYLQKRTLRHHSSSTTALQMHQCLSEIVEKVDLLSLLLKKLSPNSPTLASLDVHMENNQKAECCDLYKLYNKQCQETQELKNQVILLNTQVQNIEKRSQSQKYHKSYSPEPPPSSNNHLVDELKQEVDLIKNSEKNLRFELINWKIQLENTASTQSSEQIKNIMAELQEQKLKILGVERNLKLEFQNLLKKDVLKKKDSVGDSESLKKIKTQNLQIQGDQRKIQSEIQKLKNQVGKVNVNNIVEAVVKTLINNNLISIPQVLSQLTPNNNSSMPPAPNQQSAALTLTPSTSSSSVTPVKKKSRRKKKSATSLISPTSFTSAMRDS